MKKLSSTIRRLTCTLEQFNVKKKPVFLRTHMDLRLSNTQQNSLLAQQTTLKTLEYLINEKAAIILAADLLLPPEMPFSFESLAEILSLQLNTDIILAQDHPGEGTILMAQSLKPGKILLLDSFQEYAPEMALQIHFAQRLSRLANIYVNDSFYLSQYDHTSTTLLPSLMRYHSMGPSLATDIMTLEHLWAVSYENLTLWLEGDVTEQTIAFLAEAAQRAHTIILGGALESLATYPYTTHLSSRASSAQADLNHYQKTVQQREVSLLTTSETQQIAEHFAKTQKFLCLQDRETTAFEKDWLQLFPSSCYKVLYKNVSLPKLYSDNDWQHQGDYPKVVMQHHYKNFASLEALKYPSARDIDTILAEMAATIEPTS